MKERPILFSGAMVRALLDGSKTQTRRVIKLPAAPDNLGQWEASTMGGENGGRTATGEQVPLQGVIWHTRTGKALGCPHGQPGDQLWVRETHSVVPDHDEPAGYSAVLYQADGDAPYGKWKPSIHMFREHSRILLEIVSVRVEPLNDCSDTDAIAEGIGLNASAVGVQLTGSTETIPRAMYRDLWESINGAGSWAANPWVWVIEFKRVLP